MNLGATDFIGYGIGALYLRPRTLLTSDREELLIRPQVIHGVLSCEETCCSVEDP